MEDIKKERLVVLITSLAGIICIVQNYFGKWEIWVPWIILVAGAVLWHVHITVKIPTMARMWIYYAYAAFLLFYHGIHDRILFDISASAVLFMVTFTIIDKTVMLNMILIEYIIVMMLQLYLLYSNKELEVSNFEMMRIIFHIGTVLIMYIFSRITVIIRNQEKDNINKWQKSVKKNDNDMEDFLANLSHELRTPVNVISGMTTLMMKDTKRGELDSIKDAGIRLANQIEDIQDYMEIKRGELVLEEENYMMLSLINDVMVYYNTVYKNNKLELVVNLSPDIPAMLYGDIKKMHKLFRHILDNAVKFTGRGGINLKVYSEPQDYGVNFIVEIADTGIGMTRADMARVSKGMYQVNKKRNRSTGGIGIGLPIVYGFVHKMDGSVMITSDKGKGTTVRITIPQKVINPVPCISINDDVKQGIIFYAMLDRFKIPQIRTFYKNMVADLDKSFKTNIYFAGDIAEVDHLVKELDISHMFIGQKEFEADIEYFLKNADKGYKVVVTVDSLNDIRQYSKILVVEKPVCAFKISRILNGEIMNGDCLKKEEKVDFEGVKALVVDDEPMNLVVASGLFGEYKMIVETAQSGMEAIRKYEVDDYDVIFMDHMMPEMDGVEAMKQLRHVAEKDGRNPIVVALTANALSGAKEMFMREGFDGFIAKPIDIGEFEHVMKRELRKNGLI